jgi:hypothetical protein
MADPVRTQVHEQLANAVKGHPWLQEIFAGRVPGPVGTDDAINGLVSLVGGMISVLDLLAAEIDSLKGHSYPS